MNVGDVVLLRIAEPGRGNAKLRPAVVIAELPGVRPGALLCGVSSRAGRQVEGWDIVIHSAHADYPRSGLRVPSVSRIGWLVSAQLDADLRPIGRISDDVLGQARERLAAALLQQRPRSSPA